ncbi:TCP-1/cpn60 chaperonin family protein [Haloplanus pelagicus]|jgi:chaperonin GroEL (HSP60 family)|uniref:TCP-1/cpn60 chaperonin family protein n=1 Tax=Haloplanus pelagicus TaxID=2949995 RepID=UPI00203E23E7|nr:TCP-1/cpn60 chaperonin family protein [Haloplanus sp. HW8-1]
MSEREVNRISSAERIEADDFQEAAFGAVRSLGDIVRATYGPHGRDKLMVDPHGDGFVSNQGSDILHRLDVRDPVGGMLVDACGDADRLPDGSTFGVLLAAALIDEAEELVERGVSPVTVARGYERAATTAVEALDDVALQLERTDRERYALVTTAINGRFVDSQIDHLRQVSIDVASVLAPDFSLDDVHFEQDIRLGIDQSRVIQGTILRSDVPHDGMPQDVVDADVLLLSDPVSRLDVEDLSAIDGVDVSGPEAMSAISDSRDEQYEAALGTLCDSGADVVVCAGHLNGETLAALADAGILAFHQLTDEKFDRVRAAVGGDVAAPGGIADATLGHSGRVTVTELGSGSIKGTLFADCADTDIASVVVNAGTATGGDLTERILKQGIGALASVSADPRAIPGGGAAELVAASGVRASAAETAGKKQLAVDAFAEALETPVAQLIRNSGYDPLDVLPRLRSDHDAGERDAALDVDTGEVTSAYETGIIEPIGIKRLALDTATEFASSVLRTDAILPRTGGDDTNLQEHAPATEDMWGPEDA